MTAKEKAQELAMTFINNEISDEEIEKAAKEYDFQSTRYGAKIIFLDAIKWYKEQLKLKL